MSLRRTGMFFATLLLLLPLAAFGQATQGGGMPEKIVPCTGATGAEPCTCDHLVELAQNIMNGAIFIAVFLAAILFAYAGWLYLSNEAIGEQQRAKSLFTNVAIGLFILLSAWLIVDVLMGSLLKDNLTWNSICAKLQL
ncbi:MAG: hypothetical protein A2854_05080 [Parcubacteria group bacterium RIFCSPHIGHO2_01_FULL_56_18]|nr:MAG: hypothetical protein A2854_05080 [Parcubacteria group bacterium RIFCSPHIGHO2_01_FULL_56_18]